MCLGVPGRVTRWIDRDPLFARAMVEFGGIQRECCLACVPEADVGDYVVVHAGIAITRLNQQAAEQTLREFQSLEEMSDFEAGIADTHDGTADDGTVNKGRATNAETGRDRLP